MSAPSPSALAELARSERLEALSTSGLVREYTEGDISSGLSVLDGKFTPNNLTGEWPTPFPEHLLAAPNPVGADAKEVMLTKNRLVLDGDPGKSLTFLESLGTTVTHIRTLDIAFRSEFIDEWNLPDTGAKESWRRLASFVADHLELEKLDFALDAGQTYEDYEEKGATEEDIVYVRNVYTGIIEVLVEVLHGRKSKSFAVYWAAFHSLEGEAEKKVMGESYDSRKALGKDPAHRRIPLFPHGAPTDDTNWARGMSL